MVQVAVSAFGAWAIGRRLGGSRWRFPHPALQFAVEAAIGFLVVSYACFALSLAGLADPVSFGVLFFVLALLGALELRRITFSTITSRVTSSLREARFAYAIPLIVVHGVGLPLCPAAGHRHRRAYLPPGSSKENPRERRSYGLSRQRSGLLPAVR